MIYLELSDSDYIKDIEQLNNWEELLQFHNLMKFDLMKAESDHRKIAFVKEEDTDQLDLFHRTYSIKSVINKKTGTSNVIAKFVLRLSKVFSPTQTTESTSQLMF